MKISQKSPKKSAPAAGLLRRASWGGAPDPLDWGDPPPRAPPSPPGGRRLPLQEGVKLKRNNNYLIADVCRGTS